MSALLWVGIGGAIGSILRYLLTTFISSSRDSEFPWATFLINVVGSFAIGLVYSLSARNLIGSDLRLLLATGLCGGFTTFSTFSTETFVLLRDGHVALALLYVGGSVLAGLLATTLAFWMLRSS